MAESPTFEECAAACRVEPGAPFRLADRDTDDRSLFDDKVSAKSNWRADANAINDLQDRLYAEEKRALLVVLQGIDCSGKGGTIRRVFDQTGPRGVNVKAFGKPTPEELGHDYLWRVHNATPRKGYIGVFDRSHYEDVLVVAVRELAPAADVERRYDQINAFEKHLVENGVTILKFMLNLSKEEQGERLRDRLQSDRKRWKFNPADLDDRALWDEYQAAYDAALTRCSTPHAPWYVVPADNDDRRSAIIGRIVRGTLEEMNPTYPDPGWRLQDYELG